MRAKILVSALYLVFSTFAQAETTATFSKKEQPSQGLPNLIEESMRIAIIKESSVQEVPDDARSVFGVQTRSMTLNRLDIFANEKTVSYKQISDRPRPWRRVGVLAFSILRLLLELWVR